LGKLSSLAGRVAENILAEGVSKLAKVDMQSLFAPYNEA
jgi:hypothetical protein